MGTVGSCSDRLGKGQCALGAQLEAFSCAAWSGGAWLHLPEPIGAGCHGRHLQKEILPLCGLLPCEPRSLETGEQSLFLPL